MKNAAMKAIPRLINPRYIYPAPGKRLHIKNTKPLYLFLMKIPPVFCYTHIRLDAAKVYFIFTLKQAYLFNGEIMKLREFITRELDLPKEAALDLPLITLIGGAELRVENFKNVVEFSDGLIRIAARGHGLRVEGARLVIASITAERIVINGKISGITVV
jgi:sporulation protein YqfC